MTTEVKKIDSNGTDQYVIIPPADIFETENEYVLKADLPGVKKESLEIVLDNNHLDIKGTVDGEYKINKNLRYSEFDLYNFHRNFKVGNDIDGNKISAAVDNGVLTLTLPKREEAKPRQINIEVG